MITNRFKSRFSGKTDNDGKRHIGKSIITAVIVLTMIVTVAAGCKNKPAESGVSEQSTSNAGGSSSEDKQGFTDSEGNYYTYFDEDNDFVWDGFSDEAGNKFYFFDEDGDGNWDGYTDEDGERYYYVPDFNDSSNDGTSDAASQSGASGDGTVSSGSSTTSSGQTPQTSKGSVSNVITPHNKTSEELYKGIKGTTLKLLWHSDPNDIFLKRKQAFERAYGCKVEIVMYTWNDWQNQLLSLVVSGNVPDTMGLPDATYLKWLSRGLIQPIDEYIDPNDAVWSDYIYNVFSWKGKHYGVASTDGAGFYTIYNASMFKAKGVKTPLEYYNEGKWNFPNFRRAAIDMTYGDVTGVGIDWRWTLALCNGNSVVNLNNTKGEVKISFNEPNGIAGIELFTELFRDNYAITGKGLTDFGDGKIAMILERPWNTIGQWDLRNTKMKNTDIEICPMPKGPDVKSNMLVSVVSAEGCPSGAKNPLAACAWYYYSAKYAKKHENDPDTIADRRMTYTDAQWEFVKQFEAKAQRICTFCYGIDNWYLGDWPYWSDMIYNGLSPQAAYDKHKGIFNDYIESLSSIS